MYVHKCTCILLTIGFPKTNSTSIVDNLGGL